MPVLRYFLYVGGALLVLLFVLNAAAPTLPPAEEAGARADRVDPVIRIHSDRKLPERVVFDTTLPTIVPPAAVAIAPPAAVPAQTPVREAFARVQPSDLKTAASEHRRLEARPQPKRRIVRVYAGRPPMFRVAQQPRFGMFGNMFGNNIFGHTWMW